MACCCAPLRAFGVFAPLRHGAMAPLSARARIFAPRCVTAAIALRCEVGGFNPRIVCARSAYQLRRWWSLCAASASSARAPTGSLQRRRAPSRECSAFEKTRGRNSRARSGVWRSRRKLTASASLFKLRCAARRCWAMAAFAQQCVLRYQSWCCFVKQCLLRWNAEGSGALWRRRPTAALERLLLRCLL